MTPEEWRQIKELAAGALAEPESARDSYLSARCTDIALRREVESLLASIIEAGDLFESPALALAGAKATMEVLNEIGVGRIGERVGPYRIVEQIGEGGMGSAYLAERADEAYQKRVAIKFIKRGMDTAAVLRRFRQERQILADLDHPNIARLIDGGTTSDGLPYFVMEYVEGEPIDDYCDNRGLSIDDRLGIFLDVCSAVQHAHQRNVIHRDLKPRNILVTKTGTTKLLDFGISKVWTSDPKSESTEPTLLRAMTPLYASPEQVRGDRPTAATDVYSLGVLLYKLLTGRLPYASQEDATKDLEEAISQRIPEKPSRTILRTAGSRRLMGDLDNIVLTALRKEPDRRYATVEALSDDIQRHLKGLSVKARADEISYRATKFLSRHRVRAIEALVLAALIAILAMTTLRLHEADGPAASKRVDSIAVMPFVNAINSDSEYLSNGLTDGLIEGLSGFSMLRVAARSTVSRFEGKPQDPQAIAKDLKVGAVLLGSLSQSGDRFRLATEVVDGGDGQRLCASDYDAGMAELVGIRERIVNDVVGCLRVDLTAGNRQRLARRDTVSGEAYQLYLRGRYLWNKRTEEGFRQALRYFEQAIEIDPGYALAYTGLADCYNLLGIWGALPPREAMPRVKETAEKAISIDDSLAEAHTSLAFVRWVYDWDFARAEADFKRALALNPSYATAHDWYAYYLASAGRFDEAIAEIKRAQELEPVSLSINTDVGEIYYWARQYDRAIDQLKTVLQIQPDFAMAKHILGLTYIKIGRLQAGIAELKDANRLSSGARMLSTLGYAYGLAGNRKEAMETVHALTALSRERYTSAFATALVHAGAGNLDRAFDNLRKALDERSDSMVILRVYPPLDELRRDPRFTALLRQVATSKSHVSIAGTGR